MDNCSINSALPEGDDLCCMGEVVNLHAKVPQLRSMRCMPMVMTSINYPQTTITQSAAFSQATKQDYVL